MKKRGDQGKADRAIPASAPPKARRPLAACESPAPASLPPAEPFDCREHGAPWGCSGMTFFTCIRRHTAKGEERGRHRGERPLARYPACAACPTGAAMAARMTTREVIH